MLPKVKFSVLTFTMAAVLFMAGGWVHASDWDGVKPIVNVFSTGVSENHTSFKGLTPYFKKLEEVSGGKFKTRVFPGGVLFKLKAALKGIRENGCDSAQLALSYYPADVPTLNVIIDCLLNFQDIVAAAGATSELLALHEDLFLKELKANNIYLFGTYASGPFHLLSKKEITSLKDFKGLKVRTGMAPHIRFVKALGGVPVSMPIGEAYESITRGTVGGILGAMDFMRSYGFWDACESVTELYAGVSNGIPVPAFRRDWFDALPNVAKKALIENFAMVTARTVVDGYIKRGQQTQKTAVTEKGVKILQPSADLKKAISDYIKQDNANVVGLAVKQRGLDKDLVEQIITTYLDLHQKWSKISQEEVKVDSARFEKALKREIYTPLLIKMKLN